MTPTAEHLEQVPFYANYTSREDFDYDDDTIDSADAYQAHNDPVDPGTDDGEESLDNDDNEEIDTFLWYVALDDVTVYEAAGIDAIALLADMWDNDPDPEVSAQLVQASAKGYLSHGEGKG